MRTNLASVALLLLSIVFHGQNQPEIIENDIANFAVHLDIDPDLAFQYIKSAYEKSIAIKNDSLTARALCNLGYYYYVKNNFPESSKNYTQAIAISKKTHYYKILSSSYNQLGNMAADRDRFDESLKWYFAALKIAEASQLPDIRSRVLIDLGNLYLIQKDTVKGLYYYTSNIANARKHGLRKELAKGYVTVALLYAKSDIRKAEEFYEKAFAIVRKNKDLYTEFRIHINLSDLYLNNCESKNIDRVFRHLQEAARIQKVLRDESLLFYIDFNFGGFYLNQKQYDRALEYYNRSLALSRKNITSDQILNLYKALSDIYIFKGDFKNALVYKDRFNNLKDSIFDIAKNKSFNEIQTKYGVYKKNLKIALLTKDREIQKNRKRTMLFAGILLLCLLFAGLLFLRNRIRTQRIISLKENKIHRQEITRLEQEQELKRVKGVLEGQDLERKRLAKEIHDGIGGSLAGIKLQLSQFNTRLKDEKINVIIKQMGDAFTELRAISHNLSFNFLKDKNLEHILQQLKAEYEGRDEFNMEICIFPENSLNMLSDSVKHQIYRVVQEIIANAAKHAHATQLLVNFTKYDKKLNIIIEDNGIGFGQKHEPGIGLSNIKERVSALNGTVIIESVVGNGTTIIIDIPSHEN